MPGCIPIHLQPAQLIIFINTISVPVPLLNLGMHRYHQRGGGGSGGIAFVILGGLFCIPPFHLGLVAYLLVGWRFALSLHGVSTECGLDCEGCFTAHGLHIKHETTTRRKIAH